MNLDEQLKFALRRKEPPADFADRVLAQAIGTSENANCARSEGHSLRSGSELQEYHEFFYRWRSATKRWILTGALAGITLTAVFLQQQRQRVQGQAAKEQLMLALRITSSKLNEAQKMVQEHNETGKHRMN